MCDYSVSDHLKYLVPLVVLNLGMLCLAMYQSWKTRNLSTEFQGTVFICCVYNFNDGSLYSI